jgi:hypothetical protein
MASFIHVADSFPHLRPERGTTEEQENNSEQEKQ